MGSLLRTSAGDLRVLADFGTLCDELRTTPDDGWVAVQEQNAVQTRHLIRRSTILMVTELLDGPRAAVSARILSAG